jgi:tRNA(Ile)-lysidine synthase
LSAIEPAREDGVIRPLIDCDRTDVHRLAREQFREIAVDPSNADERFERVRIRTHLMPLLLAENPQIARHLSALADEARDYRAPLEWAARTLLAAARADLPPRTLHAAVLAERPALLRRAALRAWLQEHGATPVSRAHVEELDHALQVRRGHVWLAQGFCARATEDGRIQLIEGPGDGEQAGEP